MSKTCQEMMQALKSEDIHTWFDLGLFIDRFKENRNIPAMEYSGSFTDFLKKIADSATAFITFNFGVNGASLEVEKYAAAFRKIIKNVSIHYISGEFHSTSDGIIDPSTVKHEIKQIKCFDQWPLYDDFFETKLERGNQKYNRLIGKFWNETLIIIEKLGEYIEKNKINLIYSINVNSNPGNVSLSLALVFISEYLGIPVICNNHDFYWEGGSRKIDLDLKRAAPGPRDHFFTNADIGEFFSQIDVLFPWESRLWMNINISHNQVKKLICEKGFNPANVTEIGTAIHMQKFERLKEGNKLKVLKRISILLGGYKDRLEILHPLDVIGTRRIFKEDLTPLMVGIPQTTSHDFLANHIILLQPTRIITRKCIETNFRLLKKLCEHALVFKAFEENPKLNFSVLITGPIASGHYDYFINLLKLFHELLESLKPAYKNRCFLGFLFSFFDKPEFKKHFGEFIKMPEIYNSASLILLPSETEGRGLPIIEAATSGVPIFCRRYRPENVYRDLIGVHLEAERRFKVLDFTGDDPPDPVVDKAAQRILKPQSFEAERKHNRAVVKNRFSLKMIENRLHQILYKLYLQMEPNEKKLPQIRRIIAEYKNLCDFKNDDLQVLLKTGNRHYLPGYGRAEFMLVLKSLIDPSYFRMEEQFVRGIVMEFARELIANNTDRGSLSEEAKHHFYNTVDNLFLCQDGENDIRHDHSLAYRHRNKIYYPYRDLTHQELTGLVNLIFNRTISPIVTPSIHEGLKFNSDLQTAVAELTGSERLGIDDRNILLKKIKSNIPFAYFPGTCNQEALDILILQPIRRRLKLEAMGKISAKILKANQGALPKAFIFCPQKPCGKRMTFDSLIEYIEKGRNPELKLLIEKRICEVIRTNQLSVGIHCPQLGGNALKTLCEIKKKNGFIITDDLDAAVMTDIIDIDRFHIGKVKAEITGRILGIPMGSGYVQFAPAGIRTTLAYPVPVQTAKDFSDTLKSREFKALGTRIGAEKLWQHIQTDAETRGSPLKTVLDNLKSQKDAGKVKSEVTHSCLCGLYEDGRPWSGVIAKVNISESAKKWKFSTITGGNRTKRVTTFVEEFIDKFEKIPAVAWNGGFILNAELVGKLGLPESYIGSPLGLIITDGQVLCPPLFNKPSFLIYPDGNLDIKRVNCRGGIIISGDNCSFDLNPENHNSRRPASNEICYYDLMHTEDQIEGNGRVIVRLSGNRILEIVPAGDNAHVPILPVGLTLSFPEKRFPPQWNRTGVALQISMKGWDELEHAVEAGPMLVADGQNCIDMEEEGWKTPNSIRTQAARLDFTDMRGPKIAIGLGEKGNLSILAINGRIRESVGATHMDMAEIMTRMGIKKAMGFDPGGSSTLVVDGKELNISPYNSNYESDIWSLPPEPRAVANAVIGWQE